ncbi:MAG TPA: WYL domain-containing protein [Sphingobacteriaceae bacterium]
MSKRETLLRHSAIIRRLKKGPASFREVENHLEVESEIQDYNLRVSQRTFQRDLDDIRSLYQINIQYDFSKKKYIIEDDENEGYNDRMLEAFDTFNALNISVGLADYIDFEKRKSLGLENFHGLLHAIKNRLQLHFSYQSFWQNEPFLRKVNPYLLKEFKSRWYLIAKDLQDESVKTYALDRIKDIEITKKRFTVPALSDFKERFSNSFGIISSVDGSVPEKVVLSFSPFQGKYVKTLPLHHSQQTLVDNEEELRIQLKLYIAFDFVKELISFADDLKVIEPASLAQQVKEAHQRAGGRY